MKLCDNWEPTDLNFIEPEFKDEQHDLILLHLDLAELSRLRLGGLVPDQEKISLLFALHGVKHISAWCLAF